LIGIFGTVEESRPRCQPHPKQRTTIERRGVPTCRFEDAEPACHPVILHHVSSMTRSRQSGDHDTRLGQRRGILDLADIDLNLTWARVEPPSAALVENYPSPPMSGSPPPPLPPPKKSREILDRSQGVFQDSASDVYRGLPATQGDVRLQATGPGATRPFAAEASDRPAYSFPVPESTGPRSLSFLPPQVPMLSQPTYAGLGPSLSGYGAGSRASLPEVPGQESTKAQRKTKGHVASACVPCKRAHLRCV
jgi:hypothetical protein